VNRERVSQKDDFSDEKVVSVKLAFINYADQKSFFRQNHKK